MANTKFIAETGLLVKGDQSIFQQQVIVGNTSYDRISNPSVGSNLYVYGDLLYVGGNLHVIGNTNVQGTTSYETDFIPSSPGLKIGNETYRFNGYFDNTFVYVALYPNSNTVLLGNTTKRWVISANTIDVSGNIKISTIGTTNGSFYNSSIIIVGNNSSNVTISGSGVTITGDTGVVPQSNTLGTTLGTSTQRWILNANTGNFSGLITGLSVNTSSGLYVSGGLSTTNGAAITDTSIAVGNNTVNVVVDTTGITNRGGTGIRPASNTVGTALGTSTQRWVLNANTGDFSGLITGTAINVSANLNIGGGVTTTNGSSITNTSISVGNTDTNVSISTTGITSGGATGVNPASNTKGQILGTTTQRWALNANTGNFSGLITGTSGITITGTVSTSDLNVGTIGTTNGVSITNTNIRIGNNTISTNIGPGTIAGSMNFTSGLLFVDATNSRVGVACTSPSNTFNVQGTVGVSGVTTLASNLTVSGISHTIAGNSNFAGGGLFVDSVNGRVGIGTTNPDVRLQVAGAANVTGAFTVTGVSTFNANVNFNNGVLYVDSANQRIGINNTAPGVALRVTGAVDISSSANVQGNANVGGALGVVGNANVGGALGVVGNANVGGTLGVAGTTRLTGAANALSTFGISGAANVLSTLGVTGLITGSAGATFTGTVESSRFITGSGVATTNGSSITNTSIAVGNTDTNVSISTTGIVSGGGTGVNPVSNTKGQVLGTSTQRWVLNANTGNFSGNITANTFSGNGSGLTSVSYVTRYEKTADTTIFSGADTDTWKLGATYTPTIDSGVHTLDIQIYTELYIKQVADNAATSADISNGSSNVGNFDTGGGGGNPLMRYRVTKTYSGGNTTLFTSDYMTLSVAGTLSTQLNTVRDTTPTVGSGSVYRLEYEWIKVGSIAIANAGTVSIGTSSTANATLTGSGTEFQAWVNPRNTITVANSTGGYGTGATTVKVAAVRGPTSILLETNAGVTAAGRTFIINDPSANVQLTQTLMSFNMVGYK